MKKIIATIALSAYLLVTCGFIINAHYCMDRLASVHFFGDTPERCGECGMDMHQNDGCCRDESGVIQLRQDQVKIPVTTFELPAIQFTAELPSGFIAAPVLAVLPGRHFVNHSPPLLSMQDVYLQNRVFRI